DRTSEFISLTPNQGVMALIAADGAENLTELWQSDGTEEGTVFISTLPGEVNRLDLEEEEVFGEGKYHYQVLTISYAGEVVPTSYVLGTRLDLSPARSILIDSFDVDDVVRLATYLTVGDRLFYKYVSSEADSTWINQMRRALDQEVVDLPTFPSPSFGRQSLRVVGNHVFLPVFDREAGSEPGVHTLGDTIYRRLADIYPGRRSSDLRFFGNEENMYFTAHNPSSGYGVYRTDGTTEGTKFLADLHQLDSFQYLAEYRSLGGKLLAFTTETWTIADPRIDTLLVYPGPIPPNYQPSATLGDYGAFDDAGTDRRLVSPRDS
ncbi:MAG: hypothetical protein AAFN92_23430, partial [Bacteroidota bacterium]